MSVAQAEYNVFKTEISATVSKLREDTQKFATDANSEAASMKAMINELQSNYSTISLQAAPWSAAVSAGITASELKASEAAEKVPRAESINGHFRTVMNRAYGCNAGYIRHSIFNLIGCYNRLPIEIVSIDDVSEFQSELQKLVQIAVNNKYPYWRTYFQHR